MDWTEFVRQNLTILDLRFMVTKPRHPRYEWKGNYCHHINLWTQHGKKRLYIPLSLISDAGYIDLSKKKCFYQDMEGAKEKIFEVFNYLTEHAG